MAVRGCARGRDTLKKSDRSFERKQADGPSQAHTRLLASPRQHCAAKPQQLPQQILHPSQREPCRRQPELVRIAAAHMPLHPAADKRVVPRSWHRESYCFCRRPWLDMQPPPPVYVSALPPSLNSIQKNPMAAGTSGRRCHLRPSSRLSGAPPSPPPPLPLHRSPLALWGVAACPPRRCRAPI